MINRDCGGANMRINFGIRAASETWSRLIPIDLQTSSSARYIEADLSSLEQANDHRRNQGMFCMKQRYCSNRLSTRGGLPADLTHGKGRYHS